MSVLQNIKTIRASVANGVTLVCVSKMNPSEKIREAYEAGERIFGESRPQELVAKYNELPKEIQWHMIGSLQTNKVKFIAPFVALIHSVDSERLLDTINKEALKCDRVIDVLLEVFVATEETKHGWNESELTEYLQSGAFRGLTNVRICGVMGMASLTANTDQVRREFRHLRKLFEQLKQTYFVDSDEFKVVSMGMSGDYKIAMEEGATMVRIGSSIFK